ncbi:hypothetical protein R5R35_013120 [Gryllus longicercus]|uniref:Uncharacterized protein n=1 Tax=Gryllus longicercus TaxID=2509291 RepID=A0AAN9ZJI0_9ORTH
MWLFNNPSNTCVTCSEATKSAGSSRCASSVNTASSSTSSDTAFHSEPTSSLGLNEQEATSHDASSLPSSSQVNSRSESPNVAGRENALSANEEPNLEVREQNAGNEQPGNQCRFVDRVSRSQPVQRAMEVYDCAKSYKLVGWALCVAEKAAELASVPAAVIIKPFSSVCRTPVERADKVLCKGQDTVQTIFPSIATPSNEVAETKKTSHGA